MSFSKLFNILAVAALGLTLIGCAAKSGGNPYGSSQHGDGVSSTGGIGLGTLQRVHFPYDSSNITSDARDVLQKNANIINKNNSMRVLIEGHCDQRGSNEYNIALGERRAKTVVDYMVSLGVARRRFETKSWGEERPLDTSTSPTAYSLNRRAEFVILKK